MKVKVGDKIYDGEQEPVMVILTDQDKKNIEDMYPHCAKYCVFPDIEKWVANTFEGIKNWMDKE
jgi:hypothetical protein